MEVKPYVSLVNHISPTPKPLTQMEPIQPVQTKVINQLFSMEGGFKLP